MPDMILVWNVGYYTAGPLAATHAMYVDDAALAVNARLGPTTPLP